MQSGDFGRFAGSVTEGSGGWRIFDLLYTYKYK